MKKMILVFICILWMGVIFYNSSSSGSTSHLESMKVVNFIKAEHAKLTGSKAAAVLKVKQNSSNKAVTVKNSNNNMMDYLVRKNAHAFEYMLPAVLISVLLFMCGLKEKKQ